MKIYENSTDPVPLISILLLFSGFLTGCYEYPFQTHESIQRYEQTRYLIVTADDLGSAACIDDAFLFAAENGLVNTISAMTNFPQAVARIREVHRQDSTLSIGLHLNITTGSPLRAPAEIPSLVDETGKFYLIAELMGRVSKIDLTELERELRAQIAAFQSSGVELDHLSYQNHILALYSPFFELVIKLAKEYQVPVRNPMSISVEDERFADAGTRETASGLVRKMAWQSPIAGIKMMKYTRKEEMVRNQQKLIDEGIPFPDHMIDYVYGHPSGYNILYILNNLPPGTSELIFHLGTFCNETDIEQGMKLDREYLSLREQELVIVTSVYLKKLLLEKNIEIIGFRDLPPAH